MEQEELLAIIERIATEKHSEVDINLLRETLSNENRRSLLQLGKYNINIGQGGERIHIGDHTFVEIDDEAVTAIAATLAKSVFMLEATNVIHAKVWNKDNLKQLRKIILSVYTSKGELEIFVADEMGENLGVITNDENLRQDVFNLIRWANAKGRIRELVKAFFKCNKTNPEVVTFYRQIEGEQLALSQKSIANSSSLSNLKKIHRPTNNHPQPDTTSSTTSTYVKPVDVFLCYSHQDELLKDELIVHLSQLQRQGKIFLWQDQAIEAGVVWDAEVKRRVESANVILCLVTPCFLASDYCFENELQRAMQRHDEGSALVIPIIMKPCDWQETPFRKIQALPKNAKPITTWEDRDEALLDVVKGIRRTVSALISKSSK